MKASLDAAVLLSLLIVFLLLAAGATTVANTPTVMSTNVLQPIWQPSASETPVLRMRIGTFDPLKAIPFSLQASTAGKALRFIQFPGPIQDVWYEALMRAGLEIVTYIPDYAYVVWGSAEQLRRVGDSAPVRWEGTYYPGYALHPDLLVSPETPPTDYELTDIVVQVYSHADAEAVVAHLHAIAVEVLRPAIRTHGTIIVGIQVPRRLVTGLASLPGVITVEPLMTPESLDEVQGQLIAGNVNAIGSQPVGPGYLYWLTATVGLPTLPSAYPIVDITDDGIDEGRDSPLHPDFYELGDVQHSHRLMYNTNWTTDSAADSAGGHGNLNASIVAGYNARTGWRYQDAEGYNYGLGINPFGPIAGSKVFSNAGLWAFPQYHDMVAHAYTQGARIISNSWGDSRGKGTYRIDDQIYDGLVRDADAAMPGAQAVTILFAAGNSGSESSTIGSPGNAKNVITVGASENYRPTWVDGCFVGAIGADNANDIIRFSSRGPTADGRVKPELVAPGTHIVGAASQAATYNGMAICDTYHPAGQTLYAASSGTSHAVPAVAGAVSLLTRYYQDRFGVYPSPAMLKAYLINSARYLEGEGSGDTLPSNNQGYGSVNLGMAFDRTPHIVLDQTKLFQATGESVVISGTVAHADRPMRVTLAWTDAPGSTVGASYVNNLDLVVTIAGNSYRGNIFSGAYSIPGGKADSRNNVESVFLPAGLAGEFTLTVMATNIAGDGVPGNGDPTDQDFALVCYNCQAMPWPHSIYLPIAFQTSP
jgi:hypothetical protein